MAVHHLCDRCGRDLNSEAYQRGLVARMRHGLRPKWKFWGVTPTKSGFNDMWELSADRIDLCQKCTKEFLKFSKKGKKNGK